MSEHTEILKGLGIKTGVTYSVVPVACQQRDCIYYFDCQDNAIGLTSDQTGGFMICHDYKTDVLADGSDKKVFWKRVV